MEKERRSAASKSPAGRKPQDGRRHWTYRQRKRFVLILWICLCCFGIGFLLGRMLGKASGMIAAQLNLQTVLAGDAAEEDEESRAEPAGMDASANTKEGKDASERMESAEEVREQAKEIFASDAQLLLLVNREHPYEETDALRRRTICQGRLEAADILYEDLCAMLEAASNDGQKFWIASAYRSRQRQQQLIDEDVAALRRKQGMSRQEALEEVYKETMPAGCSEHQTGLGLDILASSDPNMDQGQEDTPENRWLQAYCYQYGFIIRYPKGKEEVTGVHYEPWHLRYVGKRAAEFLREHQLTLEEFHQMLE